MLFHKIQSDGSEAVADSSLLQTSRSEPLFFYLKNTINDQSIIKTFGNQFSFDHLINYSTNCCSPGKLTVHLRHKAVRECQKICGVSSAGYNAS